MKSYVTVSDAANYKYCPRLPGVTEIERFGGSKSVNTVIGNLEHAAFQEYYKLFRLDCLSISDPSDEWSLVTHQARLDKVLPYVINAFKEQSPSFFQHIMDNIPSLQYRLDLHHQNKVDEIMKLTNKNSWEDAVTMTLPLTIEKTIWAYNMVGRVDCIYHLPNKSLMPEDLKSHDSRFDTLIHRDSHKMQLSAYAVLLEHHFKLPVRKGRIFYTKDLSYEYFEITKKDKQEVLAIRDKVQSLLNDGLAPVLDDKLKCRHCYRQESCARIAESNVTTPTEYIPLDGECS